MAAAPLLPHKKRKFTRIPSDAKIYSLYMHCRARKCCVLESHWIPAQNHLRGAIEMQLKVEICGVNTATLSVLSAEEMDTLLHRVRDGDQAAREKLINGNLRLVLSVIQRFGGRGEPVDDLFQVGCVGLIKAIDNFNVDLGVRFSTYAVPMTIVCRNILSAYDFVLTALDSAGRICYNMLDAAMVELVDTRDLKSLGSDTVPVRARLAAPYESPLLLKRRGFLFLQHSNQIYHFKTQNK